MFKSIGELLKSDDVFGYELQFLLTIWSAATIISESESNATYREDFLMYGLCIKWVIKSDSIRVSNYRRVTRRHAISLLHIESNLDRL